jgi:hypothetical protein
MGINAVFFKYAKLGDEEILVRSVLVSEKVKPTGTRAKKPPPPPEELESSAKVRNVIELVNICRQMSAVWNEWTSAQHGGSWDYSLTTAQGWRLLSRIDVSGEGMKTPVGELDLWICCKNVAAW